LKAGDDLIQVIFGGGVVGCNVHLSLVMGLNQFFHLFQILAG
jgi:hypothetical protein